MAKKLTKNYNGKRSNIISSLKRKNIELVKQMRSQINDINPTEVQMNAVLRFEKNVKKCANITVYSENVATGEAKHIFSHTCDHKACHICNYLRQKKIRRKYFRWFEDNSEFLEIALNGKKKQFTTHAQFLRRFKKKGFEILSKHKYDIMFLTLTVPHSQDKGFRGDKFYFKKIKDIFLQLRNKEFWLSNVYGGEYGIEITKKKNGLHIHMHLLVFVKRFTQNRNKLHLAVLKDWNQLTVNPDSDRTEFDQPTREGIKKGNRMITDDFIDEMEPKGATIINLNTIFTWTDKGKMRVKEFNSDQMLYAVMEAISYHFEPQAFDKENKEFDLPLLVELLPKLYRQKLYQRFGILNNESSLSLKNNEYLEDYLEAKEVLKKDNEGLSIEHQEETYMITNPANVFHDVNEDYKIIFSKKAHQHRIDLDAINKAEAFEQVGEMVKDMAKRGKIILN